MPIHPAFRVDHGLSAWAEELLHQRVYAVLGSLNRDGSTHTAPVGFAFDGDRLLIPSRAHTHKVRNIEADPRVRVLVQATRQDGWVAADGTAVVIRGEEALELNAAADGRYFTEAGRMVWREAIGPLLDVTIVVTPRRWQSWDDSGYVRALLEAGHTAEQMDDWYLPRD